MKKLLFKSFCGIGIQKFEDFERTNLISKKIPEIRKIEILEFFSFFFLTNNRDPVNKHYIINYTPLNKLTLLPRRG